MPKMKTKKSAAKSIVSAALLGDLFELRTQLLHTTTAYSYFFPLRLDMTSHFSRGGQPTSTHAYNSSRRQRTEPPILTGAGTLPEDR